MGVNFAGARFFDVCASKGAMKGPMLALGSLTIQESEQTIEQYARERSYPRLAARNQFRLFQRPLWGDRGVCRL